nr:NACHT domain-containing protein [uncultured Actinoplanes sp.]
MERAWRTMLGLLIVVAAPLIAFWQSLARDRPVFALALALLWLAAVVAGWLVWQMVAPSARRIMRNGQAAFDSLVDQRLSRYGKVYGQWMMDSRRFLDAKGLATVGTFSPALDEVFVDVGLTERAPRQVPTDLLSSVPADRGHRQSIWDFLDQEKPVVLAVIGAPGSGKTTLLYHVARRTARTATERNRANPVLLQLRDHAAAVTEDPSMTLAELIRRAVPRLEVPEPSGWWETRLRRGKCVVLLDGLDEVASTDRRRDIVAWVEKQIALNARNDFVVTSRPHGYRDAFIDSAITLQVLSFTQDQVRQFLHGWYLAVERRATGTEGREVEMLAREAADDLLDRLAASPALYDLTINPLLLTMIANVHRFRRSLPNSRADLYGEVCEVMLWRRQEAKRLELDMQGASKLRLLGRLAYEMMCAGTRDIGRRKLLDSIRPWLRRMSTAVAPEDFVNDVGSNGLLVERERDLYAFAHLTFQEYLAARFIQEDGLERKLAESVNDPWWRESTLLYLAGANADPIVEAALRSGTPTALSLAFECAEIGAELAPELRQQLTDVMRKAFDPAADREGRRLVAGVLAGRHLRKLVPTPSGSRVCPDPVAADLYLLFRKDTGTPAPDNPRPTRQDEPIRGLWSNDARAFVRWINALAAGTNASDRVIFRLPTAMELDALVSVPGLAAQNLRDRATRIWSTGPDGMSVWAPPGHLAHHVISSHDLLADVVADLRPSGVLERLLRLTAVETAARFALTADPIRTAAKELADGTLAIRSGRDAAGLENSTALDELRVSLAEAGRLTTTVDRALGMLPRLAASDAASINQVLAGHPIAQAVADLERSASLARDVAIAQEWNRDLGVDDVLPAARAVRDRVARARRRLRELAGAEPIPVSRSLLLHKLGMEVPEPTFGGAPGQPRDTLGSSLSLAVGAMLQKPAQDDGRDALTRFAAALLHFSAGATPEPMSLDLGTLAGMVMHLPNRATHRFSSPVWASVVLRRLRETAAPVLGRQQPLTDEAAIGIRTPALVLAAEAVHAQEAVLAADLRRLAAATCLMRWRAHHTGALETLVLAAT